MIFPVTNGRIPTGASAWRAALRPRVAEDGQFPLSQRREVTAVRCDGRLLCPRMAAFAAGALFSCKHAVMMPVRTDLITFQK